MTLRNTSGKFSLAGFGRKSSSHDTPTSPARTNGNHSDDFDSPGRDSHGSGSGFDGLGKKLGKSIAHQSLLPGLGNKETRALQDIISAEKAVLQQAERLGSETQKAAASLPPFGAQEGPDLQDILTHSSTLLNQLGTALAVFTDHSANLRTCYKKIREREEALDELRRRRRATGAKSEAAEKKLAKMGPENKQLPSQTELLERLRGDMRQMDTDIITEESKLGDFKRQQVKEALSYKFGGLEELGEKMCIIGELGKLLLEEVPLEETPPGYGRAPYLGYDKTENAVNEATKCLATVRFSAGSANPKPPGLPPHNPSERLTTPRLPSHHDIAAAEEFGNYPGGADATSPPTQGRSGDYSLDASDPYGGMSNPYDPHQNHVYSDFGGTRENGNDRHVMFQGPTDDHVSAPNGGGGAISGHDYEYEQQQQLDAEERAWREPAAPATPAATTGQGDLAPAITTQAPTNDDATAEQTPSEGAGSNVPWQPLKVNRDRAVTPVSLRDGAAPRLEQPDLGEHISAQEENLVNSPTTLDLPPPPAIGGFGNQPLASPALSDRGGFYTPMGGSTPEPTFPTTMPTAPAYPSASAATAPPAPPAPPAPAAPPVSRDYSSAPGTGKISAAAFRKGPKRSMDPEELANLNARTASPDPGSARGPRRLPLPPGAAAPPGSTSGRPETPIEANFELPNSPTATSIKRRSDEAYGDAAADVNPPPQYQAAHHDSESLR